MITAPTTPQLIEVVRAELATSIAPMVGDQRTKVALQMVDQVLATLAVRAEHEIEWMVDESEAIYGIATEALQKLGDEAGLADLVAEVGDRPRESSLSEVTARYHRATELLSVLLGLTFDGPADLHERAVALLNVRLGHELEVMGDFRPIGRGAD
jgi:hypothetical protein